MRLSDEEKARRRQDRERLHRETCEEYIKRIVEQAPPLTAEQRDVLARLLAPPT